MNECSCDCHTVEGRSTPCGECRIFHDHPDWLNRSPVLAANNWKTNGDLIYDVSRLWLRSNDLLCDVTYGKGKFWTKVIPRNFVAHDKFTIDGVDFRFLPELDATYDVVVMDPAYVSVGGRETSTIHDMNNRYGMHTTEKTPQGQWEVIVEGLKEIHRVLKPKGLIWLKGMNYISSGKLQNVRSWVVPAFADIGFEIEDEFTMVGGTGPQPKTNLDGSPRRQVHARNNASFLIVARKVNPNVA